MNRIVRKVSPGFSLIEVLTAAAVLTLLLVFTVLILGNTNAAIRTSQSRMDAAAQARAALDRFEVDFLGAMLTHGSTAICTTATAGAPASVGFVCRGRAREAATGSPAWRQDLRGSIVGYRMEDRLLWRGDGRFTFEVNDVNEHASGDSSIVFTNMAAALASGGGFLNWNPLGDGVVRFHVSYQLDNGDIVQTPPEYRMSSPQTGHATTFLNGTDISPCKAIAFIPQNAPDTGALAGRHVSALIVAVAALDRTGLMQSADHLNQLDALGTPGQGGSPESDTPLVLWEGNLDAVTFPPLRQNLRFYQRVIPVP